MTDTEPISMDAPIQEVLLYKNGSKMIRTGTVSVPEGDSQVALKFLPDSMDSSSVKVTGKGKVAGRIKSMNIERQYEKGANKEELEQQEKILEGMREQESIVERKLEFYQARKGDLVKLRESFLLQFPFTLPEEKPVKFLLQSGTEEASIPSPRDTIDEFIGNIDGLIGTTVEKLVALNDEIVDLREKVDVLGRQLDQLRNKTGMKTFKKVVLDISAQNEGDFTFTVEYVIHAGFWESIYDVLISDDESDKITIKLVAAVTNDTPEDWIDIALTISNANFQPVQVIEPAPWRLREYVAYTSRMDYGAFEEKKVMGANGAPPPPPSPAAEPAFVASDKARLEMEKPSTDIGGSATGGIITFTLPSKITIKGGSFKSNIYLMEIELPGKTEFYCNLETAKLIVQNVIQNGDMQFLAGAAKIYVSDDYIGETSMNAVLPNEEFILGTRESNDLKIEKKLVKRSTDKGGVAKGKVIKNYSYMINVEILSEDARKNDLVVLDKIPYSDSELVKVQVTGDIEPKPEESKLGVMKWRIKLADQDKKFTIEYNYQVSYNSDVILDTSLP
ncbi:MAG TPA: mucoidy inhibitor MuiA family protein [Candidatus Lokiarchaeia archaeon]|nr:mucoidy inhibitor MuiA family protein [Candidatus Lokiarchaeia archaeon]